MTAVIRPFKAHVIEDEESDARVFVEELNSTGIFAPDASSNVSGDYMDKAAGADVISLDARIDGVTGPSLDAAEQLMIDNPERSVVFVTRVPREVVLESPANFIIEKYTPATASYVSTLFMLMINDKILSLLTLANNLLNESGEAHMDEFLARARRLQNSLSESSTLLTQIKVEPQGYARLASLLEAVTERPYQRTDFAGLLRFFCILLLKRVIGDVDRLKQIKGVYTTARLEQKIKELISGILSEEEAKQLVGLDQERGRLVRFSEFVGSLLGRFDARRSRGTASEKVETVEEVEPEEGLITAKWYLNIWFPDHPEDRAWIIIGEPARLFVNIGPPREQRAMSRSAGISADAESLVYSTDYVDVIVVCPGADVVPLRNRLPVPPDPERIAGFEITPRKAGILELKVELVVKNETIHVTPYLIEARGSQQLDQGDSLRKVEPE